MTELDELMQLRPLVSELRHAVEHLRREKLRADSELTAERAMNDELRKAIVAMRVAHRHDTDTPPMGVSSPETSAIVHNHRTHG